MCINEIATICSVVRDDGWKKNGTNILRLRLTFRRQSRYIKTNILLRKNQLDRNGQIKDTAVLLKVTTLIKQLEERLSSLDAFALSNMSIEDVVVQSLCNVHLLHQYGDIASRQHRSIRIFHRSTASSGNQEQ